MKNNTLQINKNEYNKSIGRNIYTYYYIKED